MKIISDLKLPFEYPFKEAISIYWKRTKQTLSILLCFFLLFTIFLVFRYIFIWNEDFFTFDLTVSLNKVEELLRFLAVSLTVMSQIILILKRQTEK